MPQAEPALNLGHSLPALLAYRHWELRPSTHAQPSSASRKTVVPLSSPKSSVSCLALPSSPVNALLMVVTEPRSLQLASCMEAPAAAFLERYCWHRPSSKCSERERGGTSEPGLPLHGTYRLVFPWDCELQLQSSQGLQHPGFSLPLGHPRVGKAASCSVQCHPTWRRGCLSALLTVPGRKGGLTVGLVWGAAILPSFWACIAGVALGSKMGQCREAVNRSHGRTWRAEALFWWTHT